MKTISRADLNDPRVASSSDDVHPLAVGVYRLIDTADRALRAWLAKRRFRRFRRQSIAALSVLDERMLRDIGIESHAEIRLVIDGLLDPVADDQHPREPVPRQADRRAANDDDRRSAA